MLEASPRSVVVTGGGTGIGRAIAAAFAGQGDQVTVTGRRAAPLKETAASLGVAWVAFDASDPAAAPPPGRVAAGRGGLGQQRGREHRLRPGGPDADDLAGLAAAWRANLDANLLSAVLMTAALAPRLEPDARIVTLGSIAARRGAGSYGRPRPPSRPGRPTSPRNSDRAGSPRTSCRPASPWAASSSGTG